MGAIGVQSGPDQVADGVNPSILATVTPVTPTTAAQQEYNFGLDTQTGAIRPLAADPAGRVVLSDTDKLTALLIQHRITNYYLWALASGTAVGALDDPDTLAADYDATGLQNTLS